MKNVRENAIPVDVSTVIRTQERIVDEFIRVALSSGEGRAMLSVSLKNLCAGRLPLENTGNDQIAQLQKSIARSAFLWLVHNIQEYREDGDG